MASDYLTEGNDPGRTGWMKDEKVFTLANVKDMKLLWKVKLESQPREMHNLFSPLIAERVTTARGAREVAIVAGISDDLFGIDVASGELLWKKRYESTFAPTDKTVYHTLCLGGQTAVPAMEQVSPGKYTIYAIAWDGRLHQINAADGSDVAPPDKFLPPNGKPYALNVVNGVVYTATAQGCGGVPNALYSYHLATRKASTFIPAGGGMWGRRGAAVSPEGVVYMVTGDAMFSPQTKSLGNAIVGARLDDNQQLQLVDYFAPPNANWMRARDLDMNVTPMAFDYRGRKFLVGTSKECRVWLLDREALGGEDHRTTLHTTPLLCNDDQAFDAKGVWGAMAAWQDSRGVQWVLVPFWGPVSRTFRAPIEYGRPKMGGVAAYKLEEVSPGQWRLNPAWLSRDMDMAEEVVVANGVVFAYGSGEDTTQTLPDLAWNEPNGPWVGGGLNPYSERRIPNSRHATHLRSRRSDRQGAVVQREPDYVLEPFQRHDGRQRARLPGDVRRHDVQLRRPGGGRKVSRAMMPRHTRSIALAATIAAAGIVWSQGRGNPNEWPTAYGDAQHTSWIRNDVSISPETMSQPGFELQWKTTLESPVRHGVSLSAGVVTSGVNIFTPLSTIAAPSNQIFAVDNDTGNLFWTRRFDGTLAAGTAACPGGISGTLTRMVSLTTPAPGAGRGGGRGRGSYSSAVGEPGAGVPIPSRGGGGPRELPRLRRHHLRRQRQRPAPRAGPSAGASAIPPGQWRPSPFPTNAAAQGSGGGLFRPSGVVYAVSADGMFRTLGLVSGKDVQRPAPFVPAGARFSDLIAVDDRVYAATSGGCGGAADGIWAIDIASDTKPVVSWKTNGGSPLGSVAFATNGTAIVAIGPGTVTAGGYANAIVALDPKTLAVKDWFRQPGVEFAAPPVLFQEAGKDIVAVTTRDGRILLLDAGSLGGTNHDTPLFASASLTGGAATFAAQSPAMWQERGPVPAAAGDRACCVTRAAGA